MKKSKELEALKNLNYTAYYERSYGDFDKQSYLILKAAIKRNEPMKVKLGYNQMSDIHYCPNCGERLFDDVEQNYCDVCGQKLDWSDEDE